jgi:5-methyltetrahydrofolate--homocysteine methyltransferase
LRQQIEERPATSPTTAINDFVSATQDDWIGGFAVTAGEASRRSPSASSRTMTTIPRSCSRRSPTGSLKRSPNICTSACAARIWGYASDERCPTEELIKEAYAGIRPAPGYPAQPDHTEKTCCSNCSKRPSAPASR